MTAPKIMPLADGYSAEFRDNGSVAIRHDAGGLHMGLGAEIAMAYEIQRLRAALEAIAVKASSDWPDRCLSTVLAARDALAPTSAEAKREHQS